MDINPFLTVEKPNFSILKLTYETKVPVTVHMPYKSIMCYISMESLLSKDSRYIVEIIF